MKTITTFIVVTMAAITGLTAMPPKEALESESRTSSPYHYIIIKGDMNVRLVQDKTHGLTVEGTSSQIKNTISLLKDDTLFIYMSNENKSGKKVSVKINVDDLNSLTVEGKTKVEGEGLINGNKFSIKAEKGAEINLNVKKDKI